MGTSRVARLQWIRKHLMFILGQVTFTWLEDSEVESIQDRDSPSWRQRWRAGNWIDVFVQFVKRVSPNRLNGDRFGSVGTRPEWRNIVQKDTRPARENNLFV